MKIGIDCSPPGGKRTGIENYILELVRAFSRIESEDRFILYPVFYQHVHDRKIFDFPDTGNFKVAFKRIPTKLLMLLWAPNRLSRIKEYMLGDVDIVHSTTYCAPRFRSKKKKLVVTIYDLTVLTHPECHTEANIRYCTKGIEDTIKYADAIIAISEHTKDDLIKHLNVPEEMITVTHLAAGPEFKEVADAATLKSVREKYALPRHYILFLGSLEPRKNIMALLKAYSSLSGSLRAEFPLVVAGGSGWMNSDIPELLKELDLEDAVFFPGYIGEEDISVVLSGASVFVYPSLYEGFGLPILEAMACGAPVITSNTSSMPEVAGTAAKLVTPTDVDELSAAMESVLESEVLRAEMRLKGLTRAAEFSWEKCARETLEVYRKLL